MNKITKVPNRDLYRTRYTDANGKQRNIYGKTRSECKQKLIRAISDKDRGLVFDAGNQTVSEYMNRWIEDSAKPTLAHRTYHNYKLQIRQHINPSIGHGKLSKLSPANIQALYAAKLQSGLKPSSVRYIHAVLHRALKQATKWNLIPINPAASVDPPKIRQEEITPFDAKQSKIFLEAVKGDQYECLYVLSLTCGLRMGEALGLKWTDIDFNARTLRINRQLQRVRRNEGISGTLTFSEPKNASRRTIDLPKKALSALRIHSKKQTGELVFTTLKDTPLEAQNVVNRHFKPLLKRADLPDIRWHDLRHTYATLLLSKGVHPKYVQQSLGHASIQLTLDRYSHWMPSMGRNTADGIDQALG